MAIVPLKKEEIVVEGQDNENFSDAGADKKSSYFTQPDSEVEVTQKMRQEGYDHKEIGEILDISVSASKAQYSKARSRIRNILEPKTTG